MNCKELSLGCQTMSQEASGQAAYFWQEQKSQRTICNKHVQGTEQQWMGVFSTNESKFNIVGSNGIVHVHRPDGQIFNWNYILPSVKHVGSNVMVWGGGGFAGLGVNLLVHIECHMGEIVFQDILENHFIHWARRTRGRVFILQMNNDSRHTSKAVKNFTTGTKQLLLS